MIKGIEHVAICSFDTKRLTDWYVRVFGFKVVYDNGKGTYFVAAPDGSMIEIIAADKDMGVCDPKDSGVRHFALTVGYDEFEEIVEKLMAENVEVVTPAGEKNGVKTFFFRDIDANIFHLIARTNPLI